MPIELFSTQDLLDLLFILTRTDRFVENLWDGHANEIDTIVKAIARRVAERKVKVDEERAKIEALRRSRR
jgi:hypothetical protein